MKLIKSPKKSLGQNFLIDKNIINKITRIVSIDSTKTIMEIGAGYGHLTSEIGNKNPKKIYAIEKDKKLAIFLNEKFKYLVPKLLIDFNNCCDPYLNCIFKFF